MSSSASMVDRAARAGQTNEVMFSEDPTGHHAPLLPPVPARAPPNPPGPVSDIYATPADAMPSMSAAGEPSKSEASMPPQGVPMPPHGVPMPPQGAPTNVAPGSTANHVPVPAPITSERPPAFASAPNELPGDGTYEVILHVMGTITEQGPGTLRASGQLQVIQGRLGPNPGDGYHAFISIGDVNVPLVASSSTSRVSSGNYLISVPATTLILELDPRTEPHLVSGFESILAWFTPWEDAARPNGADLAASPGAGNVYADSQRPPSFYPGEWSGNSMDSETAAAVQPSPAGQVEDPDALPRIERLRSAIEMGGNKGVEVVNRIGMKLTAMIALRGERAAALDADTPPKEVKLGGAATSNALGAAKSVVGYGAGIAAKVIDGVATNVENKVARSKTVSSMRSAPVGSSKRNAYELLTAGSIAIGRVYLAADHQGKLVFESAGNSATRVASSRYGEEAGQVARQTASVAIDCYRILRFPSRLGATTMVKGALGGLGAPMPHNQPA